MAGIDLDDLLDPPHGNGNLGNALKDLRDTVAAQAQLPAGFRQSVNGAVSGGLTLIAGVSTILSLYGHGKALFDALDDLLANDAPGQSLGELITRPAELAPKLDAVSDALGDVRDDIAAFPLLEGTPRDTILGTLDAVKAALGTIADATEALGNLLGEELVIRFDWKPEIKSWGFTEAEDEKLFVVHDPHSFIIAVEAKVKKSGGAPKIQVLCGLHHFDLVLIAPASFRN
ncbi:hypothetical protein H1235_10040 [Pseudoxanthomonas sp. NC8]|nr:hypothetical protein H1235_10040 [Pseudoxanthomonas sp. NC8]